MIKSICKFLFGGTLLAFTAVGCMQSKPMDDAAVAARADSIYNARKMTIMDSMNKACQANMTSWVQMKADSIYQANK